MWHLYCLPGRLITEIGYLFPKPGQLWASKRRRESGFAAFLFATVFWVVTLPVLAPLVVATLLLVAHGLGTIAWPAHSSDGSRPVAQAEGSASVPSIDPSSPAPDAGVSSSPVTSHPPAADEAQPVREVPRTKTVFAPLHEVVQRVDAPTGPATQVCSATVTDHCIER